MIIDLVDSREEHILRYKSDRVPMIGETITTLRPTKMILKVIDVDHLLVKKSVSTEMYQEIATVTVRNLIPES